MLKLWYISNIYTYVYIHIFMYQKPFLTEKKTIIMMIFARQWSREQLGFKDSKNSVPIKKKTHTILYKISR